MFITSDNTFFERGRNYDGANLRDESPTWSRGIADEAYNNDMALRSVYRVPSTLSPTAYIDDKGNLITMQVTMEPKPQSSTNLKILLAVASALLIGA